MMDPKDVDMKELKSVIKELNDAELLAEPIKIVGTKKGDLVTQFVSAIDEITENEDAVESLPEAVVEFYNNLIEDEAEDGESEDGTEDGAEEDAAEDGDDDEEETEAPPKKGKGGAKKGAKAKNKKEKKEKKKVEKSRYGHRAGSQSALIDDLLHSKGGTAAALAEELGLSTTRVKNHIKHLKDLGVTFEETEVKDPSGKTVGEGDDAKPAMVISYKPKQDSIDR